MNELSPVDRLEVALDSLQRKTAARFPFGSLEGEFAAIRYSIYKQRNPDDDVKFENFRDPRAPFSGMPPPQIKQSTGGINSTAHAVARFARS